MKKINRIQRNGCRQSNSIRTVLACLFVFVLMLAPCTAHAEPVDSKTLDPNPLVDPNSVEGQEFAKGFEGMMGLVDSFMNGSLFNPKGMPPASPGDYWNFLPDFKPGESVYENMPEPKEMEEIKIDSDAMPISDPAHLQEPENGENHHSNQVLINGSMPFDPVFNSDSGGANEESGDVVGDVFDESDLINQFGNMPGAPSVQGSDVNPAQNLENPGSSAPKTDCDH